MGTRRTLSNSFEAGGPAHLLGKYKEMMMLMQDFDEHEEELKQTAVVGGTARQIDQEDLYADKTANAAILIEKQRWVY
ncbi:MULTISPECIES: hypothetical protein [Paenibacillus]|uniref:Uncharacterized protein n=1 Tax=Paenibacillus vini TaxID=1476024 RepID=A0ABQ4MF44_9BACL|nr:hypothetical protein [Paenibacillus vini]MDN4069713.1 hypothetical protein [Paenibacillus vini]GIP54282.1 hypothetical protein J42TS3_33170 [Paenibacillus vini]